MHTHTPQGEALVEQLRWVHDAIRRDLATVRRLADEVSAGAPPEHARATIKALGTNGPLWALRINCLTYCRFVHLHHTLESAQLFPALRKANPELGAVVDKLEADHERVAEHLDLVEASCHDLMGDDSVATRGRLVDALRALATDLLAHLDFEEEQISPTLRTMTSWPH